MSEAFRKVGNWYLKGAAVLLKGLALGTVVGFGVGIADAVGDISAGEEMSISERDVALGVWSGFPLAVVLGVLFKKK